MSFLEAAVQAEGGWYALLRNYVADRVSVETLDSVGEYCRALLRSVWRVIMLLGTVVFFLGGRPYLALFLVFLWFFPDVAQLLLAGIGSFFALMRDFATWYFALPVCPEREKLVERVVNVPVDREVERIVVREVQVIADVFGDSEYRNYWQEFVVLAVLFTLCYVTFRKVYNFVAKKLVKASKRWYYTTYGPERTIPGSPFLNVGMPDFMARVFTRTAEEPWVFSGCGYRSELGFQTAWHVLEGAVFVRIERGDHSLEVSVADFIHLDKLGDVGVLALPAAVTWLKKAKHCKTGIENSVGVTAMITNGSIGSLGMLTHHPDFGFVSYGGSTARGFSGAPYYLNRTVYGMHIGSAASNYGLDAAFITTAHLLEHSSDYIERVLSSGVKHQMRVSPGDPEEVFVRYRGQYHLLAREDYDRAVNKVQRLETAAPATPSLVREAELPRVPLGLGCFDDSASENYQPGVLLPMPGQLNGRDEVVKATSGQTSTPIASSIPVPPSAQKHTEHHASMPVQLEEASNFTLGVTLESAQIQWADLEARRRGLAKDLLAATATVNRLKDLLDRNGQEVPKAQKYKKPKKPAVDRSTKPMSSAVTSMTN